MTRAVRAARQRRLSAAVGVCAAGFLLSAATAGAATFTVNDPRDLGLEHTNLTQCKSTEGTCTLRAAVHAADNLGGESTITLPAGEYGLTGEIVVNGSATSLTIDGAGAGEAIINAGKRDRAFAVQTGDTLSISGVTVENGDSESGGAFLNEGILTITGAVLSHNEAGTAGGVIDSTGSAVSVIDSTIEHNMAWAAGGGAIIAYDGSVTLTGDTITANRTLAGGKGGVLFDRESTPEPVNVVDSTVSDNEAGLFGGAFFLRGNAAAESGRLTIAGSIFAEDSSEHAGGAVFDEDFGPVDVKRSVFLRDSSRGLGGAIDIEASGPLSVSESTFSEDESSNAGGAIGTAATDTAVSRSTFARNSASGDGGAIFSGYEGDGLSLVNDTLEGNRATRGGALTLESNGERPQDEQVLLNDTIVRNVAEHGGGLTPLEGPAFPNVTIENSIVAQNTGGDCYAMAPTGSTGSGDKGGNIDSDGSCFSDTVSGDQTGLTEPDLKVAALAVGGGLSETDALLAASPAIGAGVNAPLTCPETDERGVVRAGRCDSGAYQFAPPGVPPVSPPASSYGSATGAAAKSPGGQALCRSTRVEHIHWRVPRGVHLTRILVTVNGGLYRALGPSARGYDVSLIGRAKGVVVVAVTGVTRAGPRYRSTRILHLCAPARGGRSPGGVYLKHA